MRIERGVLTSLGDGDGYGGNKSTSFSLPHSTPNDRTGPSDRIGPSTRTEQEKAQKRRGVMEWKRRGEGRGEEEEEGGGREEDGRE